MNAIADRLEIIELLGRHQITIDLGDADAYAELYAPDGRYESPFATAQGREDIREMSMRLARAGFTQGKRRLIGPMTIEVDGDEARAFSYWWVAETREAPGVYSTGTYTDRLFLPVVASAVFVAVMTAMMINVLIPLMREVLISSSYP